MRSFILYRVSHGQEFADVGSALRQVPSLRGEGKEGGLRAAGGADSGNQTLHHVIMAPVPTPSSCW